MEYQHPDPQINQITHDIIGAAIEVHRELGAGLLESSFQKCLAHEMFLRGMNFRPEVPLDIVYKGMTVDDAYRLDFVVENKVLVELKAVEKLTSIHEAQCLTYLKWSGLHLCLLINFNVLKLTDGIRRLAL